MSTINGQGVTPIGTAHGELRWWVAREYLRPTRFGESTRDGAIVWAVRPIHGRGEARRPAGAPTYFNSRTSALNYAHREARRTYRTRRTP